MYLSFKNWSRRLIDCSSSTFAYISLILLKPPLSVFFRQKNLVLFDLSKVLEIRFYCDDNNDRIRLIKEDTWEERKSLNVKREWIVYQSILSYLVSCHETRNIFDQDTYQWRRERSLSDVMHLNQILDPFIWICVFCHHYTVFFP